MRSHYDILNVSPNSTKEEIKKAFHQLSLQYHPDLTKSKSTTNNELFKQISSAYSVLSNDIQRQKYDLELDEWTKFGQHRRRSPHSNNGFGGFDHHHSRHGGGGYTNNFHRILDGIYKPKNMVIGLTLSFIAVSTFKSIFGIERDLAHSEKKQIVGDGKKKLVEAYLNPKTGQWEQPAPWSKTFQKLNPEIHLVPRSQVRPSSR